MNAVQKAIEKIDDLEIKEQWGDELIPAGLVDVEHVKNIINNLEIDILNENKTI